jgi:hypothetical protein
MCVNIEHAHDHFGHAVVLRDGLELAAGQDNLVDTAPHAHERGIVTDLVDAGARVYEGANGCENEEAGGMAQTYHHVSALLGPASRAF